MANIFHVERTDNKITLGTTGTTINIASHTASKILALDASKDLEVVTIGTSLDYTRPTLNTVQDIRTTASPTFAGLNIITDAAQALFNWTTTSSYGERAFKEGSTYIGFVGTYGTTYGGTSSGQLIFTNALNNDGGILFRTRTGGSYYDRLQILNNGNVGIGENAPETLTEWTGIAPYLTLHNSTHEDTDGGRESRLIFKGRQSGGEETTLARIEVGHDGSADDEKGYIDGYTNTGSDGDSPTKCFRWDANGTLTTLFGRILKTNRLTGNTTLDATYHQVFCDTDGGAFTVTLPAGVAGTEYRIINTGSSENNLTIAPDGAELLIGVNANWALMDGEALMIVYEATEGWF